MPFKYNKNCDKGYYTLGNGTKTIYYRSSEITTEEINNPDKEFGALENEWTYELIEESNSITLPSGVYFVNDANYTHTCNLIPFTPETDSNLIKLDVVKEVVEHFQNFISDTDQDLYSNLGLLHKTGVLLYGPPGTGKTTAIQMIIKQIRPENSLVLYFSEIPCQKLIKELAADPRLKIIIFEEFVTLIGEMSIGKLLRFLDGELSFTNMYCIASTNYPEKIPQNFINRKGRFDLVKRIGFLKLEDRKTYLKSLLKREATEEELELTKDLPISEIKYMVLMSLKGRTFKQLLKETEKHKQAIRDDFGESRQIGFYSSNDDD